MWLAGGKLSFQNLGGGKGLYDVPYSGKFSHGANFRIFHMKASVCEKKRAKFMRMRRHVRT